MVSRSLERSRWWATMVLGLLLLLGVLWFFSPGLPVLWGPYASAAAKEAGRELFVHEWQPGDPLANGDGLGPLFNARSCVTCHFTGGVGGGGLSQHKVHGFEVLPTDSHPEIRQGLVHAFAVRPDLRETPAQLRQVFPVLKGSRRVVEGCSITIPDFDPLRTETVDSPALFGAGWIDRVSSKAITTNQIRRGLANSAREFQLDFDSIGAGRPRILPDGRVGKFGWKAQFATLREFVAAACANEIGLGNPLMKQARPFHKADSADVAPDLNWTQLGNLVAFVDTLPRPTEIVPDGEREGAAALRGKELFHSAGCAICHTPDLGGVQGVYSEFLLHDVDVPDVGSGGGSYDRRQPPTPPPPEHPRAEEWKTPPLWGVADSAPYFHDGGSATLREAILRHGGEAAPSTKAFKGLSREDQEGVSAFLRTLRAPAEAEPATKGGAVQVAAR